MEKNYNECYIKFKIGNKEFEVKGDKEFVLYMYEKILPDLNEQDNSIVPEEIKKKKINKKQVVIEKEEFDAEFPLDVYFEQYKITSNSGLQEKFLATSLYLIEVKKKLKFRTREVNDILKENNFEPFSTVSIHAQRLREKNLLSTAGKEGNEALYTIYKGKINEVKKFLHNKTGG